MKQLIYVSIFLAFTLPLKAQNDSIYVDNDYLEDQIFLGFTYNVLNHKFDLLKQSGFSGGLSIGFIKDIPINKKRNVALAIGLGYEYKSFNQNLKISEGSDGTQFEIPSMEFNRNRLLSHSVILPIEFRWRTSTPTKYKFWRIYAGGKIGYAFSNTAKFSDDAETLKISGILEFRKIQYGFTLSAGYSTWNLQIYYGLNTIFKNAFVDDVPIDLTELNIGLMFYIL